MNNLLRSLAVLAIGLSVVGFGGVAEAKGKHHKGTPAALDAKFGRWLITPHGKIDGIVLDGGGVVLVHPDAVRDTSLKAGDALHLDARAKGNGATPLYVHAKITKGGAVVADDTAKHPKGQKGAKGDPSTLSDLTVTSKVGSLFLGPKGKVRGVILEDGSIAYAPHHQDLAGFALKKGDAVSVTGKGGSYALGRALVIKTIKLPNGDVKTL